MKSRTSWATKVWTRRSALNDVRSPVVASTSFRLELIRTLTEATGRRLERVAVIRSSERDPAAHPRQPAVQVKDVVRPREHPVRARQSAPNGRAVADADRGRAAVREDAAERDDDRLVADRGRHDGAVHRHRLELHRSESGGDRVEFDPVDRTAGRVADDGRRIDADRPFPPADLERRVVGGIKEQTRSVDGARDDLARHGDGRLRWSRCPRR